MGDFAKEINSTFPSERVKAMLNIKYTANWLDNIGNEILKEFNISVQQYNILRILRGAKKEITVKTVKSRMIEKSPNSTRLMDKLCQKNLISRRRSESDRRLVYIEISSEGLALLENIKIDSLQAEMDSITENEAKTLNRILDKIR
jgi:DNA-binding MarR family transcriptional regulator